MKPTFPLYAKILLWFFLNLLVVGLVAFGLLRARFGDTTDWLLASDAKARIQAMTEVLIAELVHTPTEFHDEVLDRFGSAYHLTLSVYTNGGEVVEGKKLSLPQSVLEALMENHPPPGPPPHDEPPMREHPEGLDDVFGGDPLAGLLGPPGGPPRGKFPEGPRGRPPGEGGPERQRPTFPLDLVKTTEPKTFWLLIRAPVLGESRTSPPKPVTLVGRIDSLAENGLLFDMRPWVRWGVALLLFSALFWLPLVRSLTRAITKLTRATEQIAEGNFDIQVMEQRSDELGRLGHAINIMSARLAGFVRGQKRFLGDIAHELCSPLARMEMGLGVMEQRVPVEVHERLADVQEEVREMRELVNELLSFSKAGLHVPNAPMQSLPLDEIIAEVIEREGEGNVLSDTAQGLQVLADSRLLHRALSNLVRNAIRYAGHAGPVQVSATRTNGHVTITVSDNGPGVPAEALPRLFDAFYRPDEARSRETGGVGLGLAIVKSCVEACGGTVTASNREEGGFEVMVRLKGE